MFFDLLLFPKCIPSNGEFWNNTVFKFESFKLLILDDVISGA